MSNLRLRSMILVALFCSLMAGSVSSQVRTETVAEGLEYPWALAFLPDGELLVTERVGNLRRVDRDGSLSAPLTGLPEILVKGQGGLMDLALAPDFESSREIYLSYAIGNPEANATQLARGRLGEDALEDFTIIFTEQPLRNRPVHYGARMVFLNDGSLLLTLGDAFDLREQAQNLFTHTGSIVRLTRDGQAPEDNPFIDRTDARAEIYSYGHRNPQGVVVDRQNGVVWSHEHGPRGGDELNRIEAGVNYGWPLATRGIDYSGARITPFEDWPEARSPEWGWTPSIAPAGMALYRGSAFPEWDGDLLIASLAERSLRRIDLDDDEVVDDTLIALDVSERLRDVRVSPEGQVYLLTDSTEGRILRLLPEG
ncbi:MAG: PQQ-dependent sugar dehydrogenase [Pseudomonadota bacterium]